MKLILAPIGFLQKLVSTVVKHPTVFLVIIVLVALLSWFYGQAVDRTKANHAYKKAERKSAKRQRKLEQKAYKRDNRYEINLVNDILGLIDQRLSADPNPQELLRFKEIYLQVREELRNGQPVDVPLDETLYQYYQAYNNERNSQLVQDMQLLNKYLGFSY